MKSSTDESNIQTLDPKFETSSKEKENTPNTNDPSKMIATKNIILLLGDLEIIILKVWLEQTEKAMERIVTQMGIVSFNKKRNCRQKNFEITFIGLKFRKMLLRSQSWYIHGVKIGIR